MTRPPSSCRVIHAGIDKRHVHEQDRSNLFLGCTQLDVLFLFLSSSLFSICGEMTMKIFSPGFILLFLPLCEILRLWFPADSFPTVFFLLFCPGTIESCASFWTCSQTKAPQIFRYINIYIWKSHTMDEMIKSSCTSPRKRPSHASMWPSFFFSPLCVCYYIDCVYRRYYYDITTGL